MKYLIAMSAVLALSMGVFADDKPSAATAQVTSGEEPSDFGLLTPISQTDAQEIRGANGGGIAPYALQVSSAIAAAQAYLANYRATNGNPIGTIHRNPNTLLWLFP